MAAASLGALSYGYSKNIFPKNNEHVWVVRTFNPKEPRTTGTVPVPRHKFLYPGPEKVHDVPNDWCLHVDPPIFSYAVPSYQKRFYPSSQATRCEEWSTLRQTLPTRGILKRESSQRWGVGKMPSQPKTAENNPKRYPHINSPMTRYSSSMFSCLYWLRIPQCRWIQIKFSFIHIQSCFLRFRYVDDMHLTNRLFTLHWIHKLDDVFSRFFSSIIIYSNNYTNNYYSYLENWHSKLIFRNNSLLFWGLLEKVKKILVLWKHDKLQYFWNRVLLYFFIKL